MWEPRALPLQICWRKALEPCPHHASSPFSLADIIPKAMCRRPEEPIRIRLVFSPEGEGDHIRTVHARRRGAPALAARRTGPSLAEGVRRPRAARQSPARCNFQIGAARRAVAD